MIGVTALQLLLLVSIRAIKFARLAGRAKRSKVGIVTRACHKKKEFSHQNILSDLLRSIADETDGMVDRVVVPAVWVERCPFLAW